MTSDRVSTAPTASYRVQVRPGFDLHAVAGWCDYLARLGVGGIYLSPVLVSTKGSDHGYDVVAWDRIDPQRGGGEGWSSVLAAARDRNLSVTVDIVPNHTGVADPAQNAAWWDFLRLGPDSVHADWFDVDHAAGRVKIPVLGDDFDPGQLDIVDGELRYFEHRYPIAPGTEDGSPAEVHDRQFYELVSYRRADTEQNYRRFFAVSDLAGLRVEDREVFDATHVEIARWIREDGIGGLRVDHPDGLVDPAGYLAWLRELAGPGRWLLVEKILEDGEELEAEWPVDGTTGYEALAEVGGLFIDATAEAPLDALYRELTGDRLTSAEHVAAGKRFVLATILQAEVTRLAREAHGIAQARDALIELIVRFPVYRSYLPAGSHHLGQTLEAALADRPDLTEPLELLASRLVDPADDLARRFQQTSGAVMAKGVEDTAFYRYARFVARNEVGGDPGRFATSVEDFHEAQGARQSRWPRSMTTLSTHDTKRSEDVRARLAVLAELPDEWRELVTALMSTASLPDAPFAYFLWQTFAGAGFIERDRMHAYVEKAMREAATFTHWTDPDADAEAVVHAVVERAYDDPAVHGPLTAFLDRITPFGWINSLGQKLVQLTMPGVPDVYQGSEFWDYSLVDPDNRRPVDFELRTRRLDELDDADAPPPIAPDGAAKLWVASRALRLRRDRPDLFTGYAPLFAEGPAAGHAVAFDRGGAITVATRLPVRLAARGGWRDTKVDLGGAATDVISGRSVPRVVPLVELLAEYPVALLVR